MSAPTPAPTAPAAPAAPAQPTPPAPPAKPSLEDSLASLDETTRKFVLSEVTSARTEAQGLRSRLKEAEPKLSEYDKLVEASKTDLERKAEEVTRWQTDAEKWRTAAVSARIEALAAPDFADPSDAATALADAGFLDAGGQINEAAIKTELSALLERKPHWRRNESNPAPRAPAPNYAQGSGVDGKAAANPAAEFAAILQAQLK